MANQTQKITPIDVVTQKTSTKLNLAQTTANNLTLNLKPELPNIDAYFQEDGFSEASYQLNSASTPKPIYPEESISYAESGLVLLQVEITAQGKVSAVQLGRSSGFKRLDKAAINAVKHWIFRPAIRDQIPVASQKKVVIHFELIDNVAVIR
ncbi:MAG: energy transducer TonB [Neisseriaceae bacterium]|nr:energy transducer TonB [Neisseriaceae bacterium]